MLLQLRVALCSRPWSGVCILDIEKCVVELQYRLKYVYSIGIIKYMNELHSNSKE